MHYLLVKLKKTGEIDEESDEYLIKILNIDDCTINPKNFEAFSLEESIQLQNTWFISELNYFAKEKRDLNELQFNKFSNMIQNSEPNILALMELWINQLCDYQELIDSLFVLEKCEGQTQSDKIVRDF